MEIMDRLREVIPGLAVPCTILSPETPEELICFGAAQKNDANEAFMQMSFVDNLLNTLKFVIALVKRKRTVVSIFEKKKLFHLAFFRRTGKSCPSPR